MDLTPEISQVKRTNQELLELLDRMVRKQVEYERLVRRFEQKQQVSERAQQSSRERVIEVADDRRLWVRVGDICRSKKNPNSLLPISVSNWYRGVQEGRFPQPHKLGRSSLWKLDDIKRLADLQDKISGQ
jgi:prophage regulatory protein